MTMHRFVSRLRTLTVTAVALVITAFVFTGCDSSGSSGDDEQTQEPRSISYDLSAQSNSGAVPDGVAGTVTFWEAGANQTVVTLELDDGATGTDVSHPAHIHDNTVSEGGDIAFFLSPLDGSGGGGTSARLIDQSFDDLSSFNGYVNIHESVANLSTVVSQGNVGTNAEGTMGAGLDLVSDPRSTTYSLAANSNNGAVAPNGIPGEVTFRELTSDMTMVTLSLEAGGATGANVSHPAHIHNNSASEGGDIEFYLSPVDGTDGAARSSKIIRQPYDDLASFDGYVNVHESVANLPVIVSQGNIGANAGDGGSSSADVTVTIDNIDASAWDVTSVDGASGVAGSGDNPALTLTVGTRYRFVNNGGSAHPLGFQNASAEYLLNQNGSGTLEDDGDINYAEDADGVTFTYTQTLADAVATYRCTIHASMEGDVQTGSGENNNGGEGSGDY